MWREEQYDLLLRCWQGQATDEEKNLVQEWLRQSPENYAIKEELEAYFQNILLDQSTYTVQGRGMRLLQHKIDAWETKQPEQPLPTPEPAEALVLSLKRPHFMAVAASLALLLCMATFFYLDYNRWSGTRQSMAEAAEPHMIRKQTGRGQRSKLFFPDGSVVYLNAESSIAYSDDYFVQDRTVYLEGEAFFEVEPDSTKPFKVYTRDLITRVLGTSFNIHAYGQNSASQVTVATGKVSVQDSTRELQQLTPGMQLTYDQKTRKHSITNVPAAEAAGWTQGEMVFRNMPLHQIAAELERWYDVRIEIGDKALRECRFTATFDNLSLKDAIYLLSITTTLTYEQHGRVIMLHGTSCK